MTTLRSARSKGSQFEIDAEHSLRQVYRDIRRCGGEGFYLGYDLITDTSKICFETKRLKGISWQQAKIFKELLDRRSPKDYENYLLFQSNRQPCLVMHYVSGRLSIQEFDKVFNVPFIKHLSSKVRA